MCVVCVCVCGWVRVVCGWSFTRSILSWQPKEQVTQKLKVVEDRAAAMEYRVKEKQVRDWRQEKDPLYSC